MKLDVKLDMAQLKGLLAKLGGLKVYSAFILPSILMAVAVVLLFILMPLLSSRLKSRIDRTSVSVATQLNDFSSEQLSRKQIETERQYQDAYAKEANEIMNYVIQTSQRELLSYKIFPEPTDKSVLIFHEYGRLYHRSLEKMIKELQSREPPTAVEIERTLQKSDSFSGSSSSGRSVSGGLPGGVYFDEDREDEVDQVEKMVLDELCLSVAESGLFYANVFELPGYDFWDIGRIQEGTSQSKYQYVDPNQSVRICWFWQLGYWITEDILNSIGTVNSDCSNILTCPVKRLMSLDFTQYGNTGAATSIPTSNAPGYVNKPEEGLVASLTGRVSDDKIDIIHFRVSVLANSEGVSLFIKELCSSKQHIFKGWDGEGTPKTFKHNQITILDAKIEPVATDSAEHRWYRYGNEAVFKVDLTCEYFFDKTGYDQVKPGFLKINPNQSQ